MQKKNDKLLDKIVKKDYNNELEKVLEKKTFKENTKSNLLSILYKLEVSYKDYAIVKKEVANKEKTIKKVIEGIEKNCDDINLVSKNDEYASILGNRTFLVDRKKKKIICYPIERKLLYCISKIGNKDKIVNDKYFVINRTLSDLLNVGSNINSVEPIRDFNGYSWTTIAREIESVEHNLIYQNLLFLVGEEFISKWVENKEVIIDYLELFIEKMNQKYGKKLTDEFIEALKQYSILLDIKFDKKTKEDLYKQKEEIEKKLSYMLNNKEFLEELTQTKKKLTKEIKEIDETINNKKLIQKEYDKRNENLPLEEKIFSIRILSKLMEEERTEKIKEIEEINKLMKPSKFLEYKQDLENKINILKVLDCKDLQKEIDKLKLKLQKLCLNCFEIKIKNTENKQDFLKLIYEFRYVMMLPYDIDINVSQVDKLNEQITKLKKELISKACDIKLITKLSKREDINYELLKGIFGLRVISLEELYIKLAKEKNNLYVEFFDEESKEAKEQFVPPEDYKYKNLYIMYNKKVKVFS